MWLFFLNTLLKYPEPSDLIISIEMEIPIGFRYESETKKRSESVGILHPFDKTLCDVFTKNNPVSQTQVALWESTGFTRIHRIQSWRIQQQNLADHLWVKSREKTTVINSFIQVHP